MNKLLTNIKSEVPKDTDLRSWAEKIAREKVPRSSENQDKQK